MNSILLLSCLLLAQATRERPEDRSKVQGAADEISAQAQFLWAGMIDQRQRLRTGIYRAHGRLLHEDPAQGTLEGEVHLFCAFDQTADRLRFERVEPGRIQADEKPAGKRPEVNRRESQRSWSPGVVGGVYVRAADKTLHKIAGSSQVSIGKLADPPPILVKPFDIRCLGLYYWPNYEQGHRFEDISKAGMRQVPSEIVEEAKGISRMRWTNHYPDAPVIEEDTLWVEESKGFTPIRIESRITVTTGPNANKSRETVVSDVTWSEVSGVWVPKTFRLEERASLPKRKVIELAFEWESVNETVPPKLFTMEGLELDKDTTLIDYRLGKPIWVGSIGNRNTPVIGALVAASDATKRGHRRWASILVLVNVVILLAVAISARYCRNRQRNADPSTPA